MFAKSIEAYQHENLKTSPFLWFCVPERFTAGSCVCTCDKPTGRAVFIMNTPEKELVQRFINSMNGTFLKIDTEITDQSRKSRIDIVLYITESAMIGIEFKREDKRKHGNELGQWLKQAERYSTSLFPNYYSGDYTRMPVFVCPAITYTNLVFNPDVHYHVLEDTGEHTDHNNVNSFIYAGFKIGELRVLCKTHMSLTINNYTIADLYKKDSKWKCVFHENKYRIIMNQINKL